MTNNDIMRRIRYIFDCDDTKMMTLFALGGEPATRTEISAWLKKEEDPAFEPCDDLTLAIFLNGLIADKRGKRDGPQPLPESRLSNNMIFTKLKIALNLKADDILEMLKLSDFEMSKHELSALFRKQGHKHYRVCKDQALRNFLKGMQIKYRKGDIGSDEETKHSKPEPFKSKLELPKEAGQEVDSSKDDKPQEGIWPTNFKG